MVIRDVFLFKHLHQFSPFEGTNTGAFPVCSGDISFYQVKFFKRDNR